MSLNISELRSESERILKSKEGGGNNDYLENFILMPDKVGWVDVFILSDPNTNLPLTRGGLFMPTKLIKLGENGPLNAINPRSYHTRREFVDGRWVKPADGDDCPATLHYQHLWKEIEALEKDGRVEEAEAKKDIARTIRPMPRFYYNAVEVDRDNGKADPSKAKILSVGITLHDKIINKIVGDPKKKQEPCDVTNFKNGRIFRIDKTLKGGFANYDGSEFHDPAPFGTPEEHQKWLATMHDLPSLRKVLSYDELSEKLQIHLGLKKPEHEGPYNPEDFQVRVEKPVIEVRVEETEETKVEETVASKPVSEEPKEEVQTEVKNDDMEDEILMGDEFFNKLQGLK